MVSLGQVDVFISAINAAKNIESLSAATYRQICHQGFEFFSYQLIAAPIGPRPLLYMTSYPKGWTMRYFEKHYISDDMVTRHAAQTIRPFLWPEIGALQSFTQTQRTFFHEATEFGIKAGGTVPVHGPGAAKALFSVAANMSEAAFAQLFILQRHELQLIATYAHEHILRLGLDSPPPPPTIKLSPRELEILTWTARGKTAWEISTILSLSEATVRDYAERAAIKLGSTNKIQSVAIALLHALIIP
jgi:LuxR family transcriptional activator of conjugal transfer of Ti plasmids